MADRGLNLHGDQLSAAPRNPADKQFNLNPDFAANSFDNWWQKTFAQHTAIASEASALMRVHRQVSSTGESSAGQPH
jgi:hypothetical protein